MKGRAREDNFCDWSDLREPFPAPRRNHVSNEQAEELKHKPVVFFVDDEDGIRLVVRRLLRARGFDMIGASSAEEAAEKAKLEDPPALKPEPASSKKGPKKVLILIEEERLQIEVAKSSMSIEDLLPEHRLKYERVLVEGKRVCSRCRWSYGCLMCHPEKAWDYWVRQTLGYDASKAKAKKG